MSTFLVFSDETGQYKTGASSNFYRKYPYYIRSAVILDVESWSTLKTEFHNLKRMNNLPIDKEIKWSYLWLIKQHQDSKENIPPDRPYYFLKEIPLQELLIFVTKSCELLTKCSNCKIILTVTFNDITQTATEENIYKWHLQELMQRIEMEIQSNSDNFAIIFFDFINSRVNKLLRDAYNSIYLAGDFIKQYKHIKDSISFEFSHQSFGIQMADYVAGIFKGVLRDYEYAKDLYFTHLYSLIRNDNSTGQILGYGVREVPSDNYYRSLLIQRVIKSLF